MDLRVQLIQDYDEGESIAGLGGDLWCLTQDHLRSIERERSECVTRTAGPRLEGAVTIG
jgi:hypothetical protein